MSSGVISNPFGGGPGPYPTYTISTSAGAGNAVSWDMSAQEGDVTVRERGRQIVKKRTSRPRQQSFPRCPSETELLNRIDLFYQASRRYGISRLKEAHAQIKIENPKDAFENRLRYIVIEAIEMDYSYAGALSAIQIEWENYED